MQTDLLGISTRTEREHAVARAVELLRKGEVVALPTETVYGLAADALNPIAVAKIFEAKERPRFDPLIVHLPSRDWLEKIVDVSMQHRQLILKLVDKFWPGPFTMVLQKREIVPEIVTAGLDTVAVRISAHPVFAEIVRELDQPLAAPSANRFGRISPTTAQHVLDELDRRIPLIIDGGPTEHGIESTVVAVGGDKLDILRRGPITEEQLCGLGFQPISDRQDAAATTRVRAPGQFPSHYAPETPLRVIDKAESFSPQENQRVGLLAWNPISRKGDLQIAQRRTGDRRSLKFAAIRRLSEKEDLREAAANLFRYLRELDALGLDLIVAERVPALRLGAAILDRLERASHAQPVAPGMPE
ncbi:MAG TPA: L-threonylcarbamoyladenylate synthase [Candidatus Udaeobacter sp.]|nr:L-threonylcarbamoyladenylate synthase [Candidatus Udaeobacter sp.]